LSSSRDRLMKWILRLVPEFARTGLNITGVAG
jgi:hypothetical protein